MNYQNLQELLGAVSSTGKVFFPKSRSVRFEFHQLREEIKQPILVSGPKKIMDVGQEFLEIQKKKKLARTHKTNMIMRLIFSLSLINSSFPLHNSFHHSHLSCVDFTKQ